MAITTTPHVIVASKQIAKKIEEAELKDKKKKYPAAAIQPKLQR